MAVGKQQISVQEMLARMRTGEDGDSFLITLVSSGRKNKGAKLRRKCRYGAPRQAVHHPRAKSIIDTEETVKRREHVEHGTLPMTNLDGPQPRYFTPLISHIIGYNQYEVRH